MNRRYAWLTGMMLLVIPSPLLTCIGQDGSSTPPLQPSNPYFYSVQTPFDFARALMDAFIPWSDHSGDKDL